jgi:hypothetical protein
MKRSAASSNVLIGGSSLLLVNWSTSQQPKNEETLASQSRNFTSRLARGAECSASAAWRNRPPSLYSGGRLPGWLPFPDFTKRCGRSLVGLRSKTSLGEAAYAMLVLAERPKRKYWLV